jgi:hypothetical protein
MASSNSCGKKRKKAAAEGKRIEIKLAFASEPYLFDCNVVD